ncbi:hypothetical protein BCI9360_03496 [Bacillus sp. CECT 9360]|nr:hypothetical protein BCI9360_03496 [Bacillus sp. CECT 9360]
MTIEQLKKTRQLTSPKAEIKRSCTYKEREVYTFLPKKDAEAPFSFYYVVSLTNDALLRCFSG